MRGGAGLARGPPLLLKGVARFAPGGRHDLRRSGGRCGRYLACPALADLQDRTWGVSHRCKSQAIRRPRSLPGWVAPWVPFLAPWVPFLQRKRFLPGWRQHLLRRGRNRCRLPRVHQAGEAQVNWLCGQQYHPSGDTPSPIPPSDEVTIAVLAKPCSGAEAYLSISGRTQRTGRRLKSVLSNVHTSSSCAAA